MKDVIKVERAVMSVYNRTPALAGGLAVSFFQDRFRFQGWRDTSFESWEKRRTRERGSKGRAIGVKTGRLKRSPRIIAKTRTSVFVGTDVPYAQRFNEGFNGLVNQSVRKHRVRRHTRRIRGQEQLISAHDREAFTRTQKVNQAARTFIAPSKFLDNRIEANIIHELNKELRFLHNI